MQKQMSYYFFFFPEDFGLRSLVVQKAFQTKSATFVATCVMSTAGMTLDDHVLSTINFRRRSACRIGGGGKGRCIT